MIDFLLMMIILLLISYANIYLKTSILYCIVLIFNKILTFSKSHLFDFKEKAPIELSIGASRFF